MAVATLTLSSKNYSSWSMRGWLMCKLAGIDFDEVTVEPDDADARAEILLLSPSVLVPCLTYCPPTGAPAPMRAPSTARCIRASFRCVRRCR